MISFALHCDKAHDFEGWFRSNDDFVAQQSRGLVHCPHCGSAKISKALMAPAVTTGRKKEKIALAVNAEQREVLTKLRDMAKAAIASSEDVGDKFAAEARKIHYGETPVRGIYGEATNDEVTELLDEGISVLPVPVFPEDKN